MFPLKQSLIIVLVLSTLSASAQESRIDLTQRMVDVTNAFVSSLSFQQRNNGIYAFDDEERFNWHFIPRDRKGVPFRSMNESQRNAAQNLLKTFFSAKGYQRAEAVRSLESVLAEIEVNGRFDRDPELYFLTVFGTPGLDNNWALRYEGHHLAYNWTFVSGIGIASSPQFFGSNPAEVRAGNKAGTRVLAAEEDLGRDLVNSLSLDQRQGTILDIEVPGDIFTAAEREIGPLENAGISYQDLDSRQRRMLIALIDELASMQPEVIADERMGAIRSEELDEINFVWIGGTEKGNPHYFRVQGASFLIEYDNTQNDANHVHLVWRDFAGDFGRDLIRVHYQAAATGYGSTHKHK